MPRDSDWTLLPWSVCQRSRAGNPTRSKLLDRRCVPLGRATAAEAEYRAILLGLELAASHGADPLELRSDSLLAIRAVQGEGPADAGLAALVREIRAASSGFSTVTWRWHPARENEPADALVRDLLWP
jgi:ribonuclease HI